LTNSRNPVKRETRKNDNTVQLDAENFRIELFRKAIHLSSISIPIFYLFTPRPVALAILVPLTIVVIIADISRYYFPPMESWFNQTFGWLLRSHESDQKRKRLNGATYVLIAATLAVFIFPKLIAVTSFSIFIISDLTAALVGKRFGKHRLFNKSLEGSAGFFLSALLVVAVLPKIEYVMAEYMIGIAAAIVGAIIEVLPIEVDDNLSIPLAVGGAMWTGYVLFFPAINIYKFG
jgi:dolichol kinase